MYPSHTQPNATARLILVCEAHLCSWLRTSSTSVIHPFPAAASTSILLRVSCKSRHAHQKKRRDALHLLNFSLSPDPKPCKRSLNLLYPCALRVAGAPLLAMCRRICPACRSINITRKRRMSSYIPL